MKRWLKAVGIAVGCALCVSPAAPEAFAKPVATQAENNSLQPAPKAPPQQPSENLRVIGAFFDGAALPTLIGASGQFFVPDADTNAAWKRTLAGGVSTDVQTVMRSPKGVLYAIGNRAPLFKQSAGIWSASPLKNRGASTFAKGPHSIITTGRHVYQLTAKGWSRIASARGTIRSIWAANPRRFWIATEDNLLYSGGRNSWRPIRVNLPEGDTIATLLGIASTNTVFAFTKKNRILLVTPKAARILPIPSSMAKLQIHTSAVVNGKVLVAGTIGAGTQTRSVLAQVGTKGIAELSPLWPIAEGDRFTVLVENKNQQLVVATHHGQIRIREGDGRWKNGVLKAELATPKPSFSDSKPAHTR